MAELDTLGSVIRPTYEQQLTGYKVIQDVSELPAPSSGVITSEANTVYQINGAIDLGTNRLAGSWHLFGVNPVHDSITYTGTGNMFTCTANQTINCTSIGLTCSDGSSKLISHAGGASGFIALDNTFLIGINELGDVGAMQFFFINNNFISGCLAGFSFTGTVGGRFIFSGNTALNNVGTLLGLGTAIFSNYTVTGNLSVVTPSGSTFMSGAASSANVGIRGLIESNEFSGAGSVLGTIDIQDLKWRSDGNAGLSDTETDAEVYISTPSSTTLSTDTPVIIAGTYSEVDANLFTTTAAGRMTYVGLDTMKLLISASINADPASGNNNLYEFTIAKNGTPIASSAMDASLDNNNPASVSVHALITFSTSDYIEPWVEAIGHSVNMTANKLTMIAR